MTNDDLTLKAELSEQRVQLADALQRLARNEGTTEQLNKPIASGNRLSNWQFIGFVVVMAGTLLGTMYWAANMLERRVEQVEKNLTLLVQQSERNLTTMVQQGEQNTNRRFDDMNKRFDDMNKRIEDLRQVILAQQRKR